MNFTQPLADSSVTTTDHGRNLVGDHDLLNCLSEADDSRFYLRGRYHYRDNPKSARSRVVNTDDSRTQSSASFEYQDRALTIELIHQAFASSGYPLSDVRCKFENDRLTLSGIVGSYYHAQKAIYAVRHLAPEHRLDFQIQVVTAQDVSQTLAGFSCLPD